MPTKRDPANYRRLSEPFASPEAYTESAKAFFAEVKELRKKHKDREPAPRPEQLLV